MHGVGMDERDLEPEEPGPWDPVDELGPLVREVPESLPDVGRLQGDVVHRLATSSQEAPDRRVLARRREKLHAAFAHEERRGFDPLRGQ